MTKIQDIQCDDYTLYQQFLAYWKSADYNSALNLLGTHTTQFASKAMIASLMNGAFGAVKNLEDYYDVGVTQELANDLADFNNCLAQFCKKSEYSSTTTYYRGNVVLYQDELYFYCYQTSSSGHLPTDTTYWGHLNIRGTTGANSVDLNLKYTWSDTATYAINDVVLYGNTLYYAKQASTGQTPSVGDYWGVLVEFPKAKIEVQGTQPTEQYTGQIWWEQRLGLVKGSLITMNLDGTDRTYRVLSISGTKAKVLAMFDATTIRFNTKRLYALAHTNSLDYYMEYQWYDTLTNGQDAIDLATIQQDSWYIGDDLGNPKYQGLNRDSLSYSVGLDTTEFSTSLQRHVYALSVQDVLDYLEVTPDMTIENTTLTAENLREMFWHDTVPSDATIWLRSIYSSSTTLACTVAYEYGKISGSAYSLTNIARPVFTIDLSKVTWSHTN